MPLMQAMTWSPPGVVERPTLVRPLSKVLCSPSVPVCSPSVPDLHVSGPSTPAGPGHACASCGYNPNFAARSGPSVPPSVSPGHPGASGVNMPGAPRHIQAR